MTRAYTMSQWEEDFRRAFAAHVPAPVLETQARGYLLAASNEEPEAPDHWPQPTTESIRRLRDWGNEIARREMRRGDGGADLSDEFTRSVDTAYHNVKVSGALRRQEDEEALALQIKLGTGELK